MNIHCELTLYQTPGLARLFFGVFKLQPPRGVGDILVPILQMKKQKGSNVNSLAWATQVFCDGSKMQSQVGVPPPNSCDSLCSLFQKLFWAAVRDLGSQGTTSSQRSPAPYEAMGVSVAL